MDPFDYVIVGGGSAGCVLANRLSTDPGHRVLLIEAGAAVRSPLVSMPKGVAKLLPGQRHAWRFPVAQRLVADTPSSEVWVRGKLLGGSSAINGMIYSRGHMLDYEDWNRVAGPGWGWDDMCAVYRTIEDHELGATDYRGVGGPLHVSAGSYRYPVAEAMITAGEQLGLPRRDELNHPDLEGVGYYSHTIEHGRRVSAANAFVDPVRNRPNLTVVTDVLVDRVVFDGDRAVGVAGRSKGQPIEFRSRGDVILSAGSIMSPKLLMLSGIGPSEHLRSVGIDVLVDRPTVGTGMKEHLAISMPYRMTGAHGLNRQYRGPRLAAAVASYYLTHRGSMATGPFEVGAFARSSATSDRPDIQLYLSAYTRVGSTFKTEREPGMTIYGQMLQSTSTGTIRLTSASPDAPLDIEPNWLSTEHDRASAIAMVRYMRSFMAQPALKEYVDHELVPGDAVQTDEAVLDVFRRRATCGLHAVASCAMGNADTAVVDNRLRVRGVQGLRVADCSVMPGLISGNTSGPAMALGWRAADHILSEGR